MWSGIGCGHGLMIVVSADLWLTGIKRLTESTEEVKSTAGDRNLLEMLHLLSLSLLYLPIFSAHLVSFAAPH